MFLFFEVFSMFKNLIHRFSHGEMPSISGKRLDLGMAQGHSSTLWHFSQLWASGFNNIIHIFVFYLRPTNFTIALINSTQQEVSCFGICFYSYQTYVVLLQDSFISYHV